MILPRSNLVCYNAARHARERKYLEAEWSNDSLPAVRRVLSRTYNPVADEIHCFAPVHDIGCVGTDRDWPELRNAQEEDA
eukprot:7237382-Lingulodinium_polyedra.AAC.1